MDRIFLRSVTEDDLMEIWQLYSDYEICLMCGARPVKSIVDAAFIMDILIKNNDSFTIVHKGTGKVVGLISIKKDIHRYNQNAYMLGYLLKKSYWGRGIMPQAVKLAVKYSFNNLGADVVSVAHFTENLQSKRVIEKCGFNYEGTLRKEFRRWDGKVLDSCIYSILYEEFKENEDFYKIEDQ